MWKSYLLSCLTKLAKLECLNILGRMVFVNSFMSYDVMREGIYLDICAPTNFDNETVALRTPRDDVVEGLVLEHPITMLSHMTGVGRQGAYL